jgi:hypothetical protein
VDGLGSRRDAVRTTRTHSKVATGIHAVSVVGLDMAKSVFQVHAVPALESEGQVVVRRSLRRGAVLKFCVEAAALGSVAQIP